MLQIDDHDRARLITFDRPDRANAFNEELYHASADALRAAAADDAVGAIVFTGAGKAFCAGTDLLEMAEAVPDDAGRRARSARASRPSSTRSRSSPSPCSPR